MFPPVSDMTHHHEHGVPVGLVWVALGLVTLAFTSHFWLGFIIVAVVATLSSITVAGKPLSSRGLRR